MLLKSLSCRRTIKTAWQYFQYDQDQKHTTIRGRLLQAEKHDEDVQQGVAIPEGEVFADFYRKRGRSPPRQNRECELP